MRLREFVVPDPTRALTRFSGRWEESEGTNINIVNNR